MEKIKPGMLFIAADGDGIGKLVGRAVIANDVEELHKVSNRIDAAQDFILHWCESVDGIKISGGGDEFTAAIPLEAKESLKTLRESIEKSFGYTISVGVGRNLSEAGTALLVAKLRGKDCIVWFNKKIKEDIRKAKRRVRDGRASQEEYKLSEAYLEKAEDMKCDLHKAEGEHGLYGAPDLKPGEKYHLASHSPTTGTLHYKGTVGSKKGLRSAADKRDQKHGAIMRHVVTVIPAPTTAPMVKYEHTCGLHKHEEGFHNGAADKEDKGFQNPDQEDNRTDDCAYCQDLDAQENADGSAGLHDCDACKEYDASQQNTGGIDTDDCPYCQESSEEDDCPYCQDTPEEAGGVDGCPYCESETVGEAQAGTPEGQDVDHICNCPNCPKHDATALGVQDMSAEQPDNCPQCQEMYGDAIEEQPGQTGQEDPNLQGYETAEEVLDLLDQKPGEGDQTPEAEAKKIDNTELPQGDEMEENVSVPENFGDKQKNNVSDAEKDMQNSDHECNCPDCPGSQGGEESPIDRMASPDYQGTQGDADQMAQESGQNGELGQELGQDPMAEDGQDEPDMAGVLQGGLDDHAQEQKRAQVIDQVSQTLQGFKANKAFLEEAKDQSPGLYQSTIQMLKAMIELCKLLGLEPKMSSDAPQDPGAVSEATQSDAPDGPKQAAPGGAAQDPKAQAGAAQ